MKMDPFYNQSMQFIRQDSSGDYRTIFYDPDMIRVYRRFKVQKACLPVKYIKTAETIRIVVFIDTADTGTFLIFYKLAD